MKTEYEATFLNINKREIRQKLKKINAKLIYKETLQKRYTFKFPKGHDKKHHWIRIREEAGQITMSIKAMNGHNIEDQKEMCLKINDFKTAYNFLILLGCREKSYQETKREMWKIGTVEITIDAWPFLEPLVEIEGKSKKSVKNVSHKLGFDYNQAYFGCITSIYSKKYNLPEETVNNHTPKIVFSMKNPFIKRSPKTK